MKPGARTCWVRCPRCNKFHELNLSQFSKKTPLTTQGLFCNPCSELIKKRLENQEQMRVLDQKMSEDDS